MEEKSLKINNIEINCQSLIEFSSLITVLLELAKKQKETDKKISEHDIKINNLIKLISQQKEQQQSKEEGIGWQDKENELSNILNDEHIFSMNYNNSNFSNYLNNETQNDNINTGKKSPNKNININIANNNNNDDNNILEESDKNQDNINNKEDNKNNKDMNNININNPDINMKENNNDKEIINTQIKETNINEQNNDNQNKNQNINIINDEIKDKDKDKNKEEVNNQNINNNNNMNNNIPIQEKKQEEPAIIQKHTEKNKNTEIISKIFQRIMILEKKVAELNSKLGDNMIIRTINSNKQSLKDHSNIIKKLKESNEKLTKDVDAIKEKMQDFNIYDMFKDGGDGNVDVTKALLKALESKVNKRFDLFEEKYKLISTENFKNKDDIKNLSIKLDGEKLLVQKNTEHINDIINSIKNNETLNKELREKSEQEINQKFDEINKKFEEMNNAFDNKLADLENKLNDKNKQPLLVTNLQPEKKKDKINSEVINLLKEHSGKIADLEKSMRQLLKKINIDELNSNLTILQKEVSKKGNQGAIDDIIDRLYNIDETIKQLSYKVDSSQAIEKKFMEENSNLSRKLELFGIQVNRLSMNMIKNPKEDKPLIDINKFMEIKDFEENKKEVNKKFDKIRISFEDILRHIDEILDRLTHTPTDKDFAQYQDIIKSTLDEYRINNNKKYADKYDTLKNFKFIETQIKTVNENYNKKLDGQDNWLLAKKPLNNYLCASCEGIIRGELDKRCDYIPWNKYPNRDEKYSRMGHGFSHMLQMVNDDIRKNVDNKEKEKDNKERNMKNEDKDKEKDYNSDEDKKKNSGDRNIINSAIKLPKVKQRQRNYNNLNLDENTFDKSPYDITERNLTMIDNSPHIVKISRIKKNISIKNNSTQEASINDENTSKIKNAMNVKSLISDNSSMDKKQDSE